ncbi:MAG: type II toxin-antitoxin system HicA family toxin [Bacillota bacterium]|nr:type II toxin-antitoxin system HicA family toxin [Bacillota bacterium]MDD3298413.1 type II toxin-antitoxin system HicA family toxin [Bacillota bacterium]MDD3850609.1 type II toxin-antitoxin system HicA family toxin [Bacillota bacterium]MDD4707409.1 type II toxin-antitoxin system HicA family toxin [Bacillota bacterium]
MKSYSSTELIKILNDDGWYFYKASGSHHHFKQPTKKDKVTIPHPRKDIPYKTVKNVMKQADVKPTD